MAADSVGVNLSAAEVAIGVEDPSLAFNITGIVDWSSQMPFIDLMKFSRPFNGNDGDKWGAVSHRELDASGVLDANGYPTEIPEGLRSIETIWSSSPLNNLDDRKGVYVFEYEGEGVVRVAGSGIDILSEEPGRIVFENTDGDTFGISIRKTDPNGTGDYLRDFSVIREEHIELHEAGAIFNPDWLPNVADARELRLMDWMKTNGSIQSEWADRPTLDQATWMIDGAPVEVMVRLANELGTDVWLTLPHNATEEYVREFATYVRDNLDPKLKATFEYSNEIWNWSFDQTKYLLAEAQAEWGNGDVVGYGLKKQTEMALIVDEVYAGEPEGRVVKVLAGQALNKFNTEQLLDARGWFAKEPDDAISPSEVFDAFAVTNYFGSSVSTNATLRDELQAAIDDPDVDAMAYLTEKLLDPDYPSSIPAIMGRLSGQKAMAEEAGLDFVLYEGGQHIHYVASGDLGGFFSDYNRSEHMATLYQELWDAWVEIGDGPFMQFGDVAAATLRASYAVLDSNGDSTPRAELLYDLNESVPAWWENDREEGTFLHGVIRQGDEGDDVLIGTSEEDYLIGRDGDDVFAPGRGDDGVHGGAGLDTVQVNGTIDQYRIEPIENGVRLIGPDGTDQLIDVEEIAFSDGTIARVEDLSIIFAPEPEPLPEAEPEAEAEDEPEPLLDVDPEPLPEAEPELEIDPGETYQLERGDLIKAGNGFDTASFAAEGGILVAAVSTMSTLGREMGLARDDHAYVINAKGVKADFDGVSVGSNFWSTQHNAASRDGDALSDTALETAQALGAFVTGVEAIEGTDAIDQFAGRAAADYFVGGGGNDMMAGRKGDDLLFGGDGNDVLHGGVGDDTLSGGSGRDKFIFQKRDAGVDLVLDFSVDDKLDLKTFGFASVEEVVARASAVENGTLIELSDTASIVLQDVAPETIADLTILI